MRWPCWAACPSLGPEQIRRQNLSKRVGDRLGTPTGQFHMGIKTDQRTTLIARLNRASPILRQASPSTLKDSSRTGKDNDCRVWVRQNQGFLGNTDWQHHPRVGVLRPAAISSE